MRRFLIQVTCFFLLQGLIAAGVLRNPLMDSRYMNAINDKHALLLRQASPRIVLLGGSSVAFSSDSPAILEATGLRPVNMALHAQLGVNFMLEQVKPGLRRGDTVILSFEYELFSRSEDHGILAEAIFYRPADARCLGLSEIGLILDTGLRMLCRAASSCYRGMRGDRPARKPYSRDSFNAFGDVVAHRTMPGSEELADLEEILKQASLQSHAAHKRPIRALNRFMEYCRHRGIRVAYFFPAIPKALHDEASFGVGIARELKASVPGLVFLNEPGEMAYPVELFFDTVYHLNSAGTARRTELLVARLRKWLAEDEDEEGDGHAISSIL